jgi:hypothetical protein
MISALLLKLTRQASDAHDAFSTCIHPFCILYGSVSCKGSLPSMMDALEWICRFAEDLSYLFHLCKSKLQSMIVSFH